MEIKRSLLDVYLTAKRGQIEDIDAKIIEYEREKEWDNLEDVAKMKEKLQKELWELEEKQIAICPKCKSEKSFCAPMKDNRMCAVIEVPKQKEKYETTMVKTSREQELEQVIINALKVFPLERIKNYDEERHDEYKALNSMYNEFQSILKKGKIKSEEKKMEIEKEYDDPCPDCGTQLRVEELHKWVLI